MSVQANPYPLRLEKEHMEKIKVLAKRDKRSINMQLCLAVETYLEQYEKEHGKIPVEPEDGSPGTPSKYAPTG